MHPAGKPAIAATLVFAAFAGNVAAPAQAPATFEVASCSPSPRLRRARRHAQTD